MSKVIMSNWNLDSLGEVDFSFLGDVVRKDIISRVVNWQLAKRRSGNHKVKMRGEVSGTTRKGRAQKGTGNSRMSSFRAPQYRKGGVVFGPHVRDHAHSLNKKVRQLGLRSAVLSRLKEGEISVFETVKREGSKTKDFCSFMKRSSFSSILIVDDSSVCSSLRNSIDNVPYVDVLPCHALNVYDILRHKRLIFSVNAVDYLRDFLK